MREALNKIWCKTDPNLRRLLSYLPKYRHLLAGAVACMLVAAASSSLVAYLLGKLTDLGFYDKAAWIVVARKPISPAGLAGRTFCEDPPLACEGLPEPHDR